MHDSNFLFSYICLASMITQLPKLLNQIIHPHNASKKKNEMTAGGFTITCHKTLNKGSISSLMIKTQYKSLK